MSELINNDELGVDIVTGPEGDLVRVVRDLGTIDGVANVVNAFVRELMTPYGMLARWVYDAEGLKILDADYGNPAYYLLSEPVTASWANEVVSAIQQVGDAQSRINVLGVDYELLDLAVHRVRFNIRFEVLGVPKPFNVVLSKEGAGFTAVLEE